MALLTRYTTTEAVRGVLGIDEIDLSDAKMLAQKLDILITLELDERAPGHAEKAALATGANPSASAVSDFQKLQIAAQYLGAWVIAGNPLTFLQEVGDGKNKEKRFNVTDWDALRQGFMDQATTWLNRLSDAAADADTGPALISSAPPAYDPVTNT